MNSPIRIGFVGAGHVGQSLSHYLGTYHFIIAGFLNSTHGQPSTASQAVNATLFSNYQELASASDWIFLTVPDDQITTVAALIAPFLTEQHVLFHCSGAQSATILRQDRSPTYQYCSLHPAAIFSRNNTQLTQTLLTIEGPAATVHQVTVALAPLPNRIQFIESHQKAQYHAACVFSSNFVNALLWNSQKLLQQIGVDDQFANQLVLALAQQQLDQIRVQGLTASLTGPVKRGDLTTIQRHLAVLDPPTTQLYQQLSLSLLRTGATDLPSEKTSLIKQELLNEKYSENFPRSQDTTN